MSALQAAIDGFLTAAELVALLFVSPVSAAEQPSVERTRSAPAYERARDLALVSPPSTCVCSARSRTSA